MVDYKLVGCLIDSLGFGLIWLGLVDMIWFGTI